MSFFAVFHGIFIQFTWQKKSHIYFLAKTNNPYVTRNIDINRLELAERFPRSSTLCCVSIDFNFYFKNQFF